MAPILAEDRQFSPRTANGQARAVDLPDVEERSGTDEDGMENGRDSN
jgi:hypothetical protein